MGANTASMGVWSIVVQLSASAAVAERGRATVRAIPKKSLDEGAAQRDAAGWIPRRRRLNNQDEGGRVYASRLLVQSLSACLLTLLVAANASAQASISGLVQDPTGAVLRA